MNDMFVILSDIWLDNEEVYMLLFCSCNPLFLVLIRWTGYGCLIHDSRLSLEKTLGNLETILNGYENVEVVPSLFVLMGNFCSQPFNLSFKSISSLRQVQT